MNTIKIYRIENPETWTGMWYNADGSYSGYIHSLTEGKSAWLPMDFDEKYRADGKTWLSAGKSIENMNQWFSVLDAYELDKAGYFLYEYVVSQYKVDDIQAYFTREGVVSQKQIKLNEVFDLSEIKYHQTINNEFNETSHAILGFYGKYKALSNYDDTSFAINNIIFPTSEHAFHYFKTHDLSWREQILTADTPAEAKRLGRQCPMREDWEDKKTLIVREILFHKFLQNPELTKLLLSTGYKYLEETNDWGDTYWGVCEGVGKNELGKALMFIRAALQTEDYEIDSFRPN
jgi:hypothetical protein